MNKSLKSISADFLLLVVAIIWGATFLPTQEAVNKIPVFVFLFLRFLLASFLMLLLSYKFLKNVDKKSILAGLLIGTFLFLGFVTQTYGLKYSYSSMVAFITGLNVVIVPFLMFLFFRKKASIFSLAGAIFAICGLYLLSIQDSIGLGIGEILSLFCAFFFAAQITFTGHYANKCNIFVLVFVQFLTVSIFSGFAAFFVDGIIFPQSFDTQLINAILITSIFATVFAFFAQTFLQKFTTAARVAVIFTFEPVSAGVVGYFWANEVFSTTQIIGACLIIFGVLVTEAGAYIKDKYLLKNNAKHTSEH